MFEKNFNRFKREVMETVEDGFDYFEVENSYLFGNNSSVELFVERDNVKNTISIWVEVSVCNLFDERLDPDNITLPKYNNPLLTFSIDSKPSAKKWNCFLKKILNYLDKTIKYAQKKAYKILNTYESGLTKINRTKMELKKQ